MNADWVSEDIIFTALLIALSMASRMVEGTCAICAFFDKSAIGCVSRFGRLPVRISGITHPEGSGDSSERSPSAIPIIASMPRLAPMVMIEVLSGSLWSMIGICNTGYR